jgi:hypothetical protein
MSAAAAFIGFLVVAAVAAALFESRRLPKKRARFDNRESTQPSDVFRTHYKDHGITEARFLELWSNAAQILKLDATKLRPSDRFDVELGPVKGHLAEDEIVDLQEYYSAECKRLGLQHPPHLQTLGDLVRILGAGAESP